MGVTIAYRGSLADMERVEDFEDRVVDLALELGGQVRIWRSFCDHDPQRSVRGIMLDLYPGQETTHLLISPEGWLINFAQIQDAGQARIPEPPWCVVRTQFGPVEGHVALIELLAALKREYFPDLQVTDESGYWETRDPDALQEKMRFLQSEIDGLAEGLRRFGLTPEAGQAPEMVTARIVQVARLVQQTLARIPEHPPVDWGDDEFDSVLDGTEAQWDAFFKEQRRKQERLHRATEERMARGDSVGDAFENAMRDEGLIDLPGEPSFSEAAREWLEMGDQDDEDEDEPWRESLPEIYDGGDDSDGLDDDDFDDRLSSRSRHPLSERAMDLRCRLHHLSVASGRPIDDNFANLLAAAGEILGGLAQALSDWNEAVSSGLTLVQLKRAIRGTAFAFGMLFPLRADGLLSPAEFQELADTITSIREDIHAELTQCREKREAADH